jgi:hypothetical protein
MSYENDQHNRRPASDNTSYTGWIIGGLVALAVVVGIFTMYRHNDNYTASNANSPTTTTTAPKSLPSTTGSAVPSGPAPAAR